VKTPSLEAIGPIMLAPPLHATSLRMVVKDLVEHWRASCDISGMRSLKTMLALLLALAWMPLMSHCKLETVLGFQFIRCASEGQAPVNGPGHCGGDYCCAVETGSFQAPNHQQIVPVVALALLPLGRVAICEIPLAPRETLGLFTSAPPELCTAWQFTFRTAPAPRAPSLLS